MILEANPTAGPLIDGTTSQYLCDWGVIGDTDTPSYPFTATATAPAGKELFSRGAGGTDGVVLAGFPAEGELFTSMSATASYRFPLELNTADASVTFEVWVVDPGFVYGVDPDPDPADREVLSCSWGGDRPIPDGPPYGPFEINLAPGGSDLLANFYQHVGVDNPYGLPPGDPYIYWLYFAPVSDPLVVGLDMVRGPVPPFNWDVVTVEEPVDEHGTASTIYSSPPTATEDPSPGAGDPVWEFGPVEKDIPDPDGHYIGLIKWHGERTSGFDPVDHPDACATYDGRLWLLWNIDYAFGPALIHAGNMVDGCTKFQGAVTCDRETEDVELSIDTSNLPGDPTDYTITWGYNDTDQPSPDDSTLADGPWSVGQMDAGQQIAYEIARVDDAKIGGYAVTTATDLFTGIRWPFIIRCAGGDRMTYGMTLGGSRGRFVCS